MSLEHNQILAIIVVVMALLAITIYHMYLRRKASKCSQQAAEAIAKLEELAKPNSKFTDEEVTDFLSENQSLRDEVESLYANHFVQDSLLDENGLDDYLRALNDIHDTQEQNNLIWKNILTIKATAKGLSDTINYLFGSNHYFAHSELESVKQSAATILQAFDVVYPKYREYLSDDGDLSFFDNLNETIRTVEPKRLEHNKQFVDYELVYNKTYFDTVLGKYPLDRQQRDSIVKLEDNCLVIASAGSGKTSTILAKAKYLVERRHIDPTKILLMTYTRKAADELKDRMKIDNLECGTFHGLAYKILSRINNQAPSICEASLPQAVFYRLMQTDKAFLKAINDYILNLQSLQKLEHDYDDAFSYFDDRKKYGIQALFPDMDGNIIYTRSEEEKRLCSILTQLGINFRYEQPYEHETFTNEYRQYKPDFTIYWNVGEEEKHIYLEHFAIDSLGQVPKWFGEGRDGGWYKANRIYVDGISWKRQTHAQYGTALIETKSADFHAGDVEQKLIAQLQRYGVPIHRRTDEEIYNLLVKRSKKVEKTVFTLILSFITLLKANEKSLDSLIEATKKKDPVNPNIVTVDERSHTILCDIMKPFLDKYQEALNARGEMDFTDCIIKATEICRQGLWRQYDYILVDEFQDISVDRYKFLQALRTTSPLTKLFCVGDDWQSIFRFAGSDMSLFYEFEKYFGFTEQCKIETTYRFHQPLIDKSSEFIQKNPQQKPKNITTPSGDILSTKLAFVTCEDKDDVLTQVENIVNAIPSTETIMLMGRYNYDAYSVGYRDQMGNNDNVVSVKISGRQIRFLSVHSAKGLEADHVILINCNQGAYGFPSLIEDDPILDFVLSQSEPYPYAEERRLFYVALTRAKKMAYVLYDQRRPSPFISEFQPMLTQGEYLCPACMEGKVIVQRQGVASNGTPYTVYACSNNDGGCDYFERKFGEHDHPGILIQATTTARDIEAMREQKRNGRIPPLPRANRTVFSYGTHAPVARHTPVRGYAAPFPPAQDEPQQGSADDLPF